MSCLEQENARGTELVVGWEEEAKGAEDEDGEEVERRIKVGEPIASRSFEDVDAVDVEVFLSGMGDDAGEAVGEHTRQGAGEQDGTKGDEDDHEGRAEQGVHFGDQVEADEAGTKEDLGQGHDHVVERQVFAPEKGEGG